MASRTGRSVRCSRSERAEAIPSGTPMATEMPTATVISATVSMLSSHSPIAPK